MINNQYTAVGAVTPSYDGNGNLTGDGSFGYGYDAENRLTSASGAGTTATYGYDGQGRRKLKTVNGATTVFVTDADNREVLEYDGTSGAILRWYAYGLGSNEVLNQMEVAGGTRATFIPDIQGSIIATLDSASGALSTRGYLPYGGSASAAGTFAYTGQRIDPETSGRYYYRARMYAPTWGRFMQADPIGYQGGSNLYAYVGNDPLNNTDPRGEFANFLIGAGSSVILGGIIRGVTGGSIFDLQAIAIDAAAGAVGVGIVSKAAELYQVARAGTGIARSVYLGALGEEAIGASAPKVSIPFGGRTLFPDQIVNNTIQEAKNVATISARDARQIANYAEIAAARGMNPVEVFTRPSTDVTRIQDLVNSGSVVQKFLPGISDLGIFSLTAGEAAVAGGAVGATNLRNTSPSK